MHQEIKAKFYRQQVSVFIAMVSKMNRKGLRQMGIDNGGMSVLQMFPTLSNPLPGCT